jgi:hypothetical protein
VERKREVSIIDQSHTCPPVRTTSAIPLWSSPAPSHCRCRHRHHSYRILHYHQHHPLPSVLTFAPHARQPMIGPDDGSGLSDFAVCDIDKAFELAMPSKAKVAGPGGENAKVFFLYLSHGSYVENEITL